MSIRDWLRSPRRLIAVFLSMTLAPSAVIAVLGWQLYRRDRALGAAQASARREQAADTVVAALEQRTLTIEQSLSAGSRPGLPASPDAAVLALAGTSEESPRFDDGDRLEHVERDSAAAARWYLQQSGSGSPTRRAAALIGAARNYTRAGDVTRALDLYATASGHDDASLAGVPAALLARWARCALLAAAHRRDDLRREASTLRDDLIDGRWPLTRAVLEANLDDTAVWLAGAGATVRPVPIEREALADAVDWLFRHRAELSDRGGRTAVAFRQREVTVLWKSERGVLHVLLAGPSATRHLWLDPIQRTADRQHVRVELLGPAVHPAGRLRRLTAETGLPWTVALDDTGSGVEAQRMRQRRGLWIAGLAVLAFSVLAGTSLATRAVARELAVARLQSDFVSTVSHEFRTPLTSLTQLTDMLLHRPDIGNDRRREYYEALGRQTERLHRLVENLLDFGRMESGTNPYRFSRLAVGAFVAEVSSEFESDPSARGHHVDVSMHSPETFVEADRDALRTALWNLLDNAVKYSPGCERVWVDVEAVVDAVQIRVHDRGLGIPTQEVSEIFVKFFRGERARTENIKGTGIGLAMVQHVVAAHGGSVRVQSEAGAGSTFTVSLPT